MYKNAIIYSLSANEELTKEVAKLVGIKIGNCEVMHFADGEILVENYTTVRGKDVFIIQSTCTPATERLMELLVFMDGLKRGVTGIAAEGMYTGDKKKMLFCVVTKKEVVKLKQIVLEKDRRAFVIVGEAKEVLGEGFEKYV